MSQQPQQQQPQTFVPQYGQQASQQQGGLQGQGGLGTTQLGTQGLQGQSASQHLSQRGINPSMLTKGIKLFDIESVCVGELNENHDGVKDLIEIISKEEGWLLSHNKAHLMPIKFIESTKTCEGKVCLQLNRLKNDIIKECCKCEQAMKGAEKEYMGETTKQAGTTGEKGLLEKAKELFTGKESTTGTTGTSGSTTGTTGR